MNSHERLQKTLNHEPIDKVCVDFGATHVTGISASTLSKLRKALLKKTCYIISAILDLLGIVCKGGREHIIWRASPNAAEPA